jgi:hypothetical protein
MNDTLITSDMHEHKYFEQYSIKFLREFNRYHRNNLHIYDQFKSMSYNMINSGREYYSAHTLFGNMRHETLIEERGAAGESTPFKISSQFIPLYARCFLYYEPVSSGFYQLRKPSHLYAREQVSIN